MSMADEVVSERMEPLETVRVHGFCPEPDCGGELLGTGYGMSTDRSRWVNRCAKCGKERWLLHSYPYIAHVPLKASDDKGDGL